MNAVKRAIVAMMLASVLTQFVPAPASACSPPDTPRDRTARATVIAEGWVESVTARPEFHSGFNMEDKFGRPTPDPIVPVEIVVRVTHVHRGEVSEQIVIPYHAVRGPDGGAGHLPDGKLDFGTILPCRDVFADPTGMYALLVLSGNDGKYRLVHAAGSGFFGSDQDHRLQNARAYIASVLSASPSRSAETVPDGAGVGDASPSDQSAP